MFLQFDDYASNIKNRWAYFHSHDKCGKRRGIFDSWKSANGAIIESARYILSDSIVNETVLLVMPITISPMPSIATLTLWRDIRKRCAREGLINIACDHTSIKARTLCELFSKVFNSIYNVASWASAFLTSFIEIHLSAKKRKIFIWWANCLHLRSVRCIRLFCTNLHLAPIFSRTISRSMSRLKAIKTVIQKTVI